MKLIKTYNLDKTKKEVIEEMQYIMFLAENALEDNKKTDVITSAINIANLNINFASLLNNDNKEKIIVEINANYILLNQLLDLKKVKKVVAKNKDEYDKWLIKFLSKEISA